MPESLRSGSGAYRVDGSYILVECGEDTRTAEGEHLAKVYAEVVERHGYAIILLDLRRAKSAAEAGARKALEAFGRKYASRFAIAAFGAGILARASLILITRANALLSGRPPDVHIFADEEKARRWLQEQQRELATRWGQKGSG